MSVLMSFKFTPAAWADYQDIKRFDTKTAEKIKALIADIMQTPYSGLGKPEPLKYGLSGCWSRRINAKDRLVYRVQGDELEIISCRYHYK